MLHQSVPEGLHPMGRTHAGGVCGELQPGGKTHTRVVYEGLYPVGDHVGAREELEEERTAEKICDKVDTSPFPISLCYLWEEEEEPGVKFNLGRRDVGERWF